MLYVLLYHASGYAGVVCHVNLLWLDGVPQQYSYGGSSSPRTLHRHLPLLRLLRLWTASVALFRGSAE